MTPDTQPCKGCGKPIFFGVMPSGRRCPFDAEPDPLGLWVIVDRGRDAGESTYQRSVEKRTVEVAYVELAAKQPPGATRFTSHFATCIHASSFRKSGSSKSVSV